MTQADRNMGTPRELSAGLNDQIDDVLAITGNAAGWATQVNNFLNLMKTTAAGYRIFVMPVACGRVAADGSLERVWPSGYLTSARGARAAGHYVLSLVEASPAHKIVLASGVGQFASGPAIYDAKFDDDYNQIDIRVVALTSRGTFVDGDRRVNFTIFEC